MVGVVGEEHNAVGLQLEVESAVHTVVGAHAVLQLFCRAAVELGHSHSGNAVLYPRNRRDIIITVAVNQFASVNDTNLLLYKYGEAPLE